MNDAASLLGGSPLVDDFQKVLDGISGLKVIKNVFQQTAGVQNGGDLNILELRRFLTTDLGYSVSETDSLLHSDIDFSSVTPFG